MFFLRFGGIMPLFLIFIIFNNHSHSTTIHSFALHHSPWPVFLYPHRFFAQQEKNLHEVPSRESNSGLPYSKPTRYQLSHAAPYVALRICFLIHLVHPCGVGVAPLLLDLEADVSSWRTITSIMLRLKSMILVHSVGNS